MELDDLKDAWRRLDRRLAEQNALHLVALRERKLDRARTSLRPLSFYYVFQIAFGAGSALFAGPLWPQALGHGHLLWNVLAVHVYGLLLIASGAWALFLVGEVDYGRPVVEIQTRLARLRSATVRTGWLVGLPWWWLWIPYGALFMAWNGVDLFTKVPPSWYWINVAICAGGMLATIAFVAWARRPQRPRLARRVDDLIAGRSLVDAERTLDEIARFERDAERAA